MLYNGLEAVFWSFLTSDTATTPAPQSSYWHAFQHIAILPVECRQETFIFESALVPTTGTNEAQQAFLISLKRHMSFPFDDDPQIVFSVAFECTFQYQLSTLLQPIESWFQVWVEDELSVAAQTFFRQVEQQVVWQISTKGPIVGVTTFVG